ncbi:hypothetical protein K458DRAFT_347515, partial [Lentithecium fluviatile CBS 122367]
MYDYSSHDLYGSGNATTIVKFDEWGVDRTIPRFFTAVTAIAWYNALEMLVLIFCVFKKYSGLYFWSLLITTASVIPYATGEWMKDSNLFPNDLVTEIFMSVGFVIMVPGQSLVLYSRLHLVTENRTLLRFVFWMIITNAVVLCVPTITLNFHQHFARPEGYTRAYVIMDKIEVSVFTAQEIFISCVYLWEVHKTLKIILDERARKSMWQLVAMNILHLTLDAALLTVGFLDFHAIQWTFKGFAYSIKLKTEFAILTQLVHIVKSRNNPEKLEIIIPKSPEGVVRQKAPNRQSYPSQMMQGNIPREWRLSVGISEIVSPSARERKGNQLQSPISTESVDMYPGRLG